MKNVWGIFIENTVFLKTMRSANVGGGLLCWELHKEWWEWLFCCEDCIQVIEKNGTLDPREDTITQSQKDTYKTGNKLDTKPVY